MFSYVYIIYDQIEKWAKFQLKINKIIHYYECGILKFHRKETIYSRRIHVHPIQTHGEIYIKFQYIIYSLNIETYM